MIIIGTPEECLEKIIRYEEAGVDQLLCYVQFGDVPHEKVMRSLELLGTKVIPELEAADTASTPAPPWPAERRDHHGHDLRHPEPGRHGEPQGADGPDERPALSDELIRQSLKGRTAVITGAAGGIGRQAALTFTQAGANVVIADVGVDGLDETANVGADRRSGHRRAHRRRRPDQVNALAVAAVKAHGRLDVWANVAGIIRTSLVVDSTPEDDGGGAAVNLWGTYVWGSRRPGGP